MAASTDKNREMIANRLNIFISVVNRRLLCAEALSAAKNGNIQQISDKLKQKN